jgi:hypothetical protein
MHFIEVPRAVLLHFYNKAVHLIEYDQAEDMLLYELIDQPGSRISYSCRHLLNTAPSMKRKS